MRKVTAASKRRIRSNLKPDVPCTFQRIVEMHPDVAAAHEHMARAVDAVGPLNRRLCELIKIGICVGAGLESALRSHVRRALNAGATHIQIEQAVLLGMTTVGFPRTVAAWSWAQQQFERDKKAGTIGRRASMRSPPGPKRD